jgi:hypothetical protein
MSQNPTDLAPAIETAAQQPLSVTADGLSVTAQPIEAQILADRYAAAKAARSLRGRGLMFSRLYGPPQVAVGGTMPQPPVDPGLY